MLRVTVSDYYYVRVFVKLINKDDATNGTAVVVITHNLNASM